MCLTHKRHKGGRGGDTVCMHSRNLTKARKGPILIKGQRGVPSLAEDDRWFTFLVQLAAALVGARLVPEEHSTMFPGKGVWPSTFSAAHDGPVWSSAAQ